MPWWLFIVRTKNLWRGCINEDELGTHGVGYFETDRYTNLKTGDTEITHLLICLHANDEMRFS